MIIDSFFFVSLARPISMSTMKLSIIVPVYNVEKYIRPCMESIFRQGLDEADYEVIIVNDGTKDHSMEVIEDIISAQWYCSSKGRVYPHARLRRFAS